MGLFETAAVALNSAERRVEIAARNVANANTPGYKREAAYTEIAGAEARGSLTSAARPSTGSVRVVDQGALIESGSPLDLAINGDAFMLVRDGERLIASRGGSFAMAADGSIVDAQGRSLQQAGGGDLQLESGQLVIHEDGSVLVDDAPMGAVGLYAGADLDRTAFETGLAPAQVASVAENSEAVLRQGMLERSNVTLSDEMVGLMQTQRMSEAAAQILRTYDQLTAQATSTFNRSGK